MAYPSVYTGLTPAYQPGVDQPDLEMTTAAGVPVSYIEATMEYETSALPGDYIPNCRLQLAAGGDWHPQLGYPGKKAFINGTLRAPAFSTQDAAMLAWQAIGYTVVINGLYSAQDFGSVLSQTILGVPIDYFDLVPLAGVVTLSVSLGQIVTPRSRTFVTVRS